MSGSAPQPCSNQTESLFIFYNSRSGGTNAVAFVKGGVTRMELHSPYRVCLYIYDISEHPSGHKEGFLRLKETVMASELPYTRVLAAGGDGTVMWMISEICAHAIELAKVAIGVVPYGTGNDLARCLGWQALVGLNPYRNNFATLHSAIGSWLHSKIAWMDLWAITIQFHANGTLQSIDSSTRAKRFIPLTGSHHHHFKMCNYFSLGIESRIGLGFERHRTTNACCNKTRYGLEGVKKTMFQKTPLVNDFVANMEEILPSSETQLEGPEEEVRVVFSCNPEDTAPHLQKTASLIVLNISSFASGLNVWDASKKSALKPPTKDAWTAQDIGDRRLEFVSFPSGLSLGLERTIKGSCRRVHQGSGPFHLNFLPPNPRLRVYLQIDGEYFIAANIMRITIRHHDQVKVMRKAS